MRRASKTVGKKKGEKANHASEQETPKRVNGH